MVIGPRVRRGDEPHADAVRPRPELRRRQGDRRGRAAAAERAAARDDGPAVRPVEREEVETVDVAAELHRQRARWRRSGYVTPVAAPASRRPDRRARLAVPRPPPRAAARSPDSADRAGCRRPGHRSRVTRRAPRSARAGRRGAPAGPCRRTAASAAISFGRSAVVQSPLPARRRGMERDELREDRSESGQRRLRRHCTVEPDSDLHVGRRVQQGGADLVVRERVGARRCRARRRCEDERLQAGCLLRECRGVLGESRAAGIVCWQRRGVQFEHAAEPGGQALQRRGDVGVGSRCARRPRDTDPCQAYAELLQRGGLRKVVERRADCDPGPRRPRRAVVRRAAVAVPAAVARTIGSASNEARFAAQSTAVTCTG